MPLPCSVQLQGTGSMTAFVRHAWHSAHAACHSLPSRVQLLRNSLCFFMYMLMACLSAPTSQVFGQMCKLGNVPDMI